MPLVDTISTEDCRVERDDHVVVVTLDRPEAKNALSTAMLVGMADAWQYVNETPEVRVAILTGAGGAFCAGADLKAMAAPDERYQHRLAEDPDLHWKALLRHYRVHKPLIAAVEGAAVAGGTEILQATDIRVAGESAYFGIYEAKRGLFPLGGSTVRLQHQISFTHAMELLLTARRVDAHEAAAIGLIGHVVPDGDTLTEARGIAATIAANGPLAVQAIKESVLATRDLGEEEGLARELEIGMPVFASEDATEGPRAFAEKRTPEFRGR